MASAIKNADAVAERLNDVVMALHRGVYCAAGQLDRGRLVEDLKAVAMTEVDDPYGWCPHCGGKGVARERRLGGNDTCENGHVYPSRASVGGAGRAEGPQGENNTRLVRG